MQLQKAIRRAGDIRNRHGFSLWDVIVLVVVLTILALLSVIALKVRARFKLDSNATQCKNNLARIGQAFALYEHDFEEKIPHAGLRAGIGFHWSWDDLINKQLGGNLTREELRKGEIPVDIPVLRCPSDTVPLNPVNAKRGSHRRTYVMPQHDMKDGNWPPAPSNRTGLGLWWDLGPGSLNPYSSNRWVKVQSPEEPEGKITQATFYTSTIPDPKQTILLTERPFKNNIIGNVSVCTIGRVSDHIDPKSGLDLAVYHKGRFNYLFVDGHVENLAPEKTLGKSNPSPAYQSGMWTVDPTD